MSSMGKLLMEVLVVVVAALWATTSLGGGWAVAARTTKVHVVGGDRGWDPSSDLATWSSARTFRVGDEIWISYSVAQGVIAELKSKEEYESCDARNPIKMYTDGLHAIPLEREGLRYFVSSEPENCKKGLKLHVEVLPMMNITDSHSHSPSSSADIASSEADAIATRLVEADGPSSPSASAPRGVSYVSVLIMLCVFLSMVLHV